MTKNNFLKIYNRIPWSLVFILTFFVVWILNLNVKISLSIYALIAFIDIFATILEKKKIQLILDVIAIIILIGFLIFS